MVNVADRRHHIDTESVNRQGGKRENGLVITPNYIVLNNCEYLVVVYG